MPLSPAVRLPVLREVNRARSKLLDEARQGKASTGFSKGSFKGRSPSWILLDSHRESELVRLMHSYVKRKKGKKKKEKERKFLGNATCGFSRFIARAYSRIHWTIV